MKNSISLGSSISFKDHGTGIFLDNICANNDANEFPNSFKYTYPKECELKTEHEGTPTTFLGLHISTEGGIVIYQLNEKKDEFPFLIVRMSYVPCNVSNSIF